jgi:hypothetical protein
MKKLKMNYRSQSSGQIIAVLIIMLGLVGVGFWWLFSNKQAMAKEGREFGREAIQRIVVQRDAAFFASRLSPQARLQFPPSALQEFFFDIERLGAPVVPLDVQGDIEFQSQFFEPTGNFHAHVNYPARGADINVAISHPVGRWQIDAVSFMPGKER